MVAGWGGCCTATRTQKNSSTWSISLATSPTPTSSPNDYSSSSSSWLTKKATFFTVFFSLPGLEGGIVIFFFLCSNTAGAAAAGSCSIRSMRRFSSRRGATAAARATAVAGRDSSSRTDRGRRYSSGRDRNMWEIPQWSFQGCSLNCSSTFILHVTGTK